MKNTSKLKDWVNNGFITQAQADQIVQYEDRSPETSWTLIGFVTLGAIIIGLGILSVIAANWEKTPAELKLFINFTILIALATACFINYRPYKNLKYDILLLSFMLFCIGSIALIGQIFHTSSPYYLVALFWVAITAIATSTTQRTITWLIWIGVLLGGLLQYCFWSDFIQKNLGEYIFLNVTFLLYFSWLITVKYFENYGLKWAIGFWAINYSICALIFNEVRNQFYSETEAIDVNLISLISLGLVVYAIFESIRLNKIQKILGASVAIMLLISSYIASLGLKLDFLIAICSIIFLSSAAVFMASMHKKWLFNLFLGLLFVRFLILYFQALGGLAATGAGLVGAGVLIIYFAILWKRKGRKLLEKLEGWTDAKS